MPTKKELAASSKSIKAIGKSLGVDSIGYLSIEGMLGLKALPKDEFCTACFTGKYPIKTYNKH
jgi:amidophosphoribosyltransferase